MTDIPASLEQLVASQIQDGGNRRTERANAPFDTPQNFWFSAIYELPFGAGKRYLNQNKVVGHLLGDWSISAVLNYQSGLPLRITQTNRLLLFSSSQRPNRVPGQNARTDISYNDFDPAINRLFNPASFAEAGANAFGNAAPRLSDARGSGIRKEDVAIRKNMRFTEQLRMEFNVQVFNLLNRPQWGREGRVFAARTTDGGKTWNFVSWIGPEPSGFSIMPSSARISKSRILTTLRRKEGDRHWIGAWATRW